MSLDVLEVASQVILQGGHHAAVFVHQLGGAGLSGEPVHHRRQVLLLDLLTGQQAHACNNRGRPDSAGLNAAGVNSVTYHLFCEDL